VCCSVLQCVAVRDSALQSVAVCYGVYLESISRLHSILPTR